MIAPLVLALLAATSPEEEPPIEFAVVVHPANEVEGLTRDELASIFKAEQQFWKGSGAIYLILPPSRSHEKQYLLEEVYGLDEAQLKRYWLELVFRNKIPAVPKVLPSGALTLAVVAKHSEAIGFVRVDAIDAESTAKVLAIDGKRPGDEGYPLVARPEKEDERRDDREGSGPPPRGGSGSARAVFASHEDGDEDGTAARLEELERELGALRERIELDEELERAFALGPKLKLRGFTDVVFGVRETDRDAPGADEWSNGFALGQLDLFITSQLAPRLSALSEVVLTAETDGTASTNVARAIVKYHFSDALDVQAGRFHTTLGHWNEAYHHGEWFHTTIGRPRIVEFDAEGGVLPTQLVGLVVKGRHDVAGTALDYTVEVGNGRGPTRGFDQVGGDVDEAKAVNLSLGIQPDDVDGLRFGGGVYFDEIPRNANAAAGPVHGRIDETILNGYATYHGERWEVLAEYFRVQHDGGATDPDSASDGYYVQVGHRLGAWTPYARVEQVVVDDASTFFEDPADLDRYLVGTRWDFSTWSALKFQLAYTEVDAGPGGIDEDEIELAVQWSYAF